MVRTSARALIENVPMPQPSIATQVKLSCANPADRHPDFFEVRATVCCALATIRERLHPLGPQLFVGGNERVEIGAREWAGHGLPWPQRQSTCANPNRFKKLATVPADIVRA